MSQEAKKVEKKTIDDDFQPLSQETLQSIYGGIGTGFSELTGLRVKCPVSGCNFECNDFGIMNEHIKANHPQI